MFGRPGLRSSLVAATILLVACGDDATTGGAGGEPSTDSVGCEGATLLDNPADTSTRGPWPVGVRTVVVEGLTVEVWYPAELGSDANAEAVVYDVRSFLPASEQGKIDDDDAPFQTCACYREIALDAGHGPFPVVMFVHGTGGFRSQSLEITTHWASRGFVVMAADHPGLSLADVLGPLCGSEEVERDIERDLSALIAAAESPAGELSFLAGHIDASRIGLVGHSAGGRAVGDGADVAQVIIPMAAAGVSPGSALESSLVLGAVEDQVVAHEQQIDGFQSSPSPKRLVGISPAGHLTFSSLCAIVNDAGKDLVEIGQASMVCGLEFAGPLFDCDDAYLEPERGWTIVSDATSAVLEETLHCKPERAATIADIRSRYAEVVDYREEL